MQELISQLETLVAAAKEAAVSYETGTKQNVNYRLVRENMQEVKKVAQAVRDAILEQNRKRFEK